MTNAEITAPLWQAWQKIVFRFFFIFYCLFITPWGFLGLIPKSDLVLNYLDNAMEATIFFFNKILFHIPHATKPPNGNGDYPEEWMMVATYAVLAAVGCITWSILDRKRKEYNKLNYWFSLFLRYFIILNGIQYGIIKIFSLQMPYPNLSQLATPLGDYLPMRFSWMFIGYSNTYQFFSGAIELLAAVLLMFRKTATLGVLVATGVFLNVMMLNLSYDIPVKINSISLVVVCLYVLAMETPRLYRFFAMQQASPSRIFIYPFTKRRKILAIVIKCLVIGLALYGEADTVIRRLDQISKRKMPAPITAGIYDVITHTNMGNAITAGMPDSVYWQNIVFDRGYSGSIKTYDSRFRQFYGRSYFNFEIDSAKKILSIKKTLADSVSIAQFTYNIKDSSLVELFSYPRRDSIYLLLRKRTSPFPLSRNEFHWVSETNR